ncbi:hypothetical protein Hanom_Chr12g01108321 [Helianthus anomalus]
MEEGDDLRTRSFRDEDYNTRRAFLTSYPLLFDKEEDHQETQAYTPATTQSYRVETGEKKKEKMKNIIVEWAGGRAMVLRRFKYKVSFYVFACYPTGFKPPN